MTNTLKNTIQTKRLWITFGVAIFAAFFILGWFGREVYRKAPPIPERVVTESGRSLLTRDDILTGQQVWQSIGGQQLGSIWGHGAYQAPDWTADWLHREATALQALLSRKLYSASFAELDSGQQAVVNAELRQQMRANTYRQDGTVVVSELRAQAMQTAAAHYRALFGGDPGLESLRESYALQDNAIPDPQRREKMTAFFFWTAWAAATRAPGAGDDLYQQLAA